VRTDSSGHASASKGVLHNISAVQSVALAHFYLSDLTEATKQTNSCWLQTEYRAAVVSGFKDRHQAACRSATADASRLV
jgi:hypothetical protein